MKRKSPHGLRTWIEVDRKAVKHNFGVFKKLIPKKTRLMAVVKSNAYGHGLVAFSKEMEKLGADFLGVDSITEGLALRREGVRPPILVLGYTLPEMLAPAAEADISLTVSSFESLQAVLKAKTTKPLKVHIKVDTGMHRQGFLAGDLPKIIGMFHVPCSMLHVEGLYTHFASAKNPAFPVDTREQLAEFRKWVTAFKKAGIRPIIHAAATAGTMLFPESHFDMVRVGIGLYGLWPAKEVKEYFHGRLTLRPALTWKSIITEIKTFPKGTRIGYDLTEALSEDSKLAVIPIGYWHGYPRAFSSIGRVLVKPARTTGVVRSGGGQSAKVVGRVSMDMLIIDVTDVKALKVGEEVTVLDKEASSPASAENLGYISDSSWYEVITRLNPLIKKIYI